MDNERIYKPKEYTNEELKHKCGIYQIRNLVNNKLYVGSSNDLLKRKREHFRTLNKEIHCNKKLQRAFDKYSEQNFIFEIIEFVEDKNKLIEYEQYWINTLKSVQEGYNINIVAGKGPVYKKSIICLETNKVYDSISEAHKLTGFARSAIGDNCNNKVNACRGYHFMFYNDFLNLDKNKVLEKMLLEGSHKKIICLNTNEIFFSMKDACIKYSLDSSSLTHCCKNKQVETKGLRFMYYKDYLTSTKEYINHIKTRRYIKEYNKNTKPVICLNTLEVYRGSKEVELKLGIPRNCINRCCRNEYKTTKNNTRWMYYDDYLKLSK